MAQWSPAQNRRGRRGQQHADLAAEVFRSLFTGVRDVGSAGRRAEWTCSCGVTNFADRRDCRYCEKARGGQQAQVLERSVGVPKSAAEKPPGARADAIGRVAQSARAAGASQSAIGVLQEEAKSFRDQARQARPPGAQFDAARQDLQRAEKAAESAKKAVENAKKRAEQAEERLKKAKADMDELEVRMREERQRELPILRPNDNLLQSMRNLLGALQQLPFPDGIPRDVHVAMDAAMAAAGPAEKTDEEKRCSPAEDPDEARRRSRSAEDASLGSGDRARWADEENVDDLMESLDDEDEDNVDALAKIARRLKKARCV